MSKSSEYPANASASVKVLISATRLRRRVAELAAAITCDYASQDVVLVALLNGTVIFLADLIRRLDFPLRLDFIGVSSYGSATQPGVIEFTKALRLDVRGRHVLVVDDILDTGGTLRAVMAKLRTLRPASLKTCVLLDKPERRVHAVVADYVGFKIADQFVVGYGLDCDERFRNLPYVGILPSGFDPNPSPKPLKRTAKPRK